MNSKAKIIFILLIFSSGAVMAVDDSTGLILKTGKVFKLHTLERGQGLNAVARRYNIEVAQIKESNPETGKDIIAGQVLLIPTNKTESQFFGNLKPVYTKFRGEYSKPAPSKVVDDEKKTGNSEVSGKTSFSNFYTVQKGETLYSISQKFNTSVDFLKQLNKLKTDHIEIGKDILVPVNESLTTEPVVENTADAEKADSLNHNTSIHQDPVLVSNNSTYNVVVENIPEYNILKVRETGLGQVMTDKKIKQDKDWVIHHIAPENTILRITNPANNKTIYARVVKNFARTDKDPLIIYLNKKTADYLELSPKAPFNIELSFTK